jgi:predicted flap endonuclease-1-like 5' DNA nuclease
VVAPAPSTAATDAPAAQDLTRIRAIDEELQKALNGLGVMRYQQIADWKPAEVARIGEALKLPGRIEQENWIEQAQILAKGGETYYSRRKLKGEIANARPTPDEGERLTIRVPAATRPADAVAPVAVAPVAVAAAPSAPVASSAALDAASAVQAAQAAVSAATAPIAATAAAAAAAAAASASAANTEAPVAAAPEAAPPIPAPAPASASGDRPIGMARDSLQRIAGINAEVERLLNVQGVTRYLQIANWSQSDVARFDRLLGFEGRIARENWIEQAQILAKGGETAYARDMARRASETARPARLADALQTRAAEAAAAAVPVGTAPATSERTGTQDLSVLRSVRSEAYRGSEPAAAPADAPRPGDDLKRIRGVGVLIEKKLNALGVSRYDQIANWTAADIERFSEKLDFKGRIERENWVEQARILSAGGQTEFSQRVDRGEVESSKPKI